MAQAAAKIETIVKQAAPSALKIRESVNVLWRLAVDQTITPEDLTQPGFWSVVQDKFRSLDEIMVAHPDWIAEVLIEAAEKGAPVRAMVLHVHQRPPRANGAKHDLVPVGMQLSLTR